MLGRAIFGGVARRGLGAGPVVGYKVSVKTGHVPDPAAGMLRRVPGDLYELAAAPADPGLSNADLIPTRVVDRTWSTYHMASLWVGLSVCIPTYMLAASLVNGGMNWMQAVLLALGLAAGCVLLFVYGLGQTLPVFGYWFG